MVLRQTLCFTSCRGQLLKTYKAEIYDREPWSIPPKFLLYKIQDSNRALHMVGTKSCRRKWVHPTGPKRSRFGPSPEIRTLLAALQLIVTRLPVPLCTVSKGYFFFFRSNVTIETPASAMDMVMRNCACLRFRYSRENPSFSIWHICMAMAGINQS